MQIKKFKIPKPKIPHIPHIPKPGKPHVPKPGKPHVPNVSEEVRRAIDISLQPVHEELNQLRKMIPDSNALADTILSSVQETFDKLDEALDTQIQIAVQMAVDSVESKVDSVESKVDSVESKVNKVEKQVADLGKDIGDKVADGLSDAFGELVDLATKGVLKEALEKITDEAEKEIFEGDAPIKLETAYLDIILTDAKLLARTIREMVKEGVPTSKREWRYIIMDLSPKAIKIKPGIPLIAQLTKKIPLEDLERKALEAILKKAGL